MEVINNVGDGRKNHRCVPVSAAEILLFAIRFSNSKQTKKFILCACEWAKADLPHQESPRYNDLERVHVVRKLMVFTEYCNHKALAVIALSESPQSLDGDATSSTVKWVFLLRDLKYINRADLSQDAASTGSQIYRRATTPAPGNDIIQKEEITIRLRSLYTATTQTSYATQILISGEGRSRRKYTEVWPGTWRHDCRRGF